MGTQLELGDGDSERSCPKFRAGDVLDFDGVKFIVERGNRAPGDLRFFIQTPGGHRVLYKQELMFAMYDGKCQVEDNNYPPSRGFEGANKLEKAMRLARLRGWYAAAEQVRLEREAKRRREAA